VGKSSEFSWRLYGSVCQWLHCLCLLLSHCPDHPLLQVCGIFVLFLGGAQVLMWWGECPTHPR